MSLNKYLFLAVLSLVCLSCSNRDTKIVFPNAVPEEVKLYIEEYKYLVIIYMDLAQCTGCALNSLNPWTGYKKTLEKHNTGILLVFRNPDENSIIEYLKTMNMPFMFIFDKMGEFKVKNRIFTSEKDKVCVIDKDKNMIFSESPIKNEETWSQFTALIKK